MKNVQPGILAPVPRLARYMEFSLVPDEDVRPCLEALMEIADGELVVVGLGASAVAALGKNIEGLGVFPADSGPGFEVPSTPEVAEVVIGVKTITDGAKPKIITHAKKKKAG